MTRINTIEPADLLDQHLFAEWRELPRIFALARPLRPREVVPAFRLGSGHVRFFYPLTGWLAARHAALTAELEARGYNLTPRAPLEPLEGLDGDWSPGPVDHRRSLERLAERQAARPGFYRLRGDTAGPGHYDELLEKYAPSLSIEAA